jgi:hypothetical protein
MSSNPQKQLKLLSFLAASL